MISHAHVMGVARETECNSLATTYGSNTLPPSNRLKADDWNSNIYKKTDGRVLFEQILHDYLSFDTERVSIATADGSSNLLPSNRLRADDWIFTKYNKTDARVLVFKQRLNDYLSFARETAFD